jgi:hypothetical protein
VRFWRGDNRPPLKEETHKESAARFVERLLRRYPDTAGLWIAARDIKDHLLDEFQRECGSLGSYTWMARGLPKVMDDKNALQSEPEGLRHMGCIPTDQGAASTCATEIAPSISEVAGNRRAANHLSKSVVREFCTLRSVGAGGG